jgi:Tfp pilus assembly protein PilW
MSHDPVRPRRRPAGIALAEAMISLAICASLLTAVGVGLVASSNAIRTNDEFTKATQAGRVILIQLEDQIRSGWLDPSVVTDANGYATQFRMITASTTAKSPDRTYKYDAATKRLLLVTNAYPADADFVLARNLTMCKFAIQKGVDANGHEAVTQVGVTLTVSVGKSQVTLSGSAAPRRSLSK